MPQRAGNSLRPSRPTRFPGRWKFQHMSPRRGRQRALDAAGTANVFQPTFPRGGRPVMNVEDIDQRTFQPTSPRGGRPLTATIPWGRFSEFQPTSPCGGRPGLWPAATTRRYFNPRPHAGDDNALLPWAARSGISTHVPMRGTTPAGCRKLSLQRFQPTSPCGGRPGRRSVLPMVRCISTHVPMRGTTRHSDSADQHQTISTHVPMRGTTA